MAVITVAATAFPAQPAPKGGGRDQRGPVVAFNRRGLESRHRKANERYHLRGMLPVPAPIREDFETPAFPPVGWAISNPDPASITWEYASGVSGYGSGVGSAWMDFYSYEISPGHRDELRTPAVTGLLATDSLVLDYAYAEYDDPFYGPDSLLITVSTNGGGTFPLTIFADGGATLATGAPTTLPFSPGSSDWRTLRLPLPVAVAGSPVVVSFTAVNGYSNNLFIDNVFLGSVPANDIQALKVLTPASGSKQRTTLQPRGIIRNAGTGGQVSVPTRFQILSPTGTLLYDSPVVITTLSSGESDTVTYPGFTVPATAGIYTARLLARNIGDENPGNDTVVSQFFRPGMISGLIMVGPGGTLPTLRSAVDTLNHSDVVGPLTFRLTGPLYNEVAPLTISEVDGSGPSAPVTFVPAPGLAVTVNVPGTPEQSYALAIRGSSHITIDGGDPTSSLTIRATGDDGAVALYVAGLMGRPSCYNTLSNLALQTAADSGSSSSGYYGLLLAGYDETQKDTGNTVIRCAISRHGQAGIAVQNVHALRIESSSIRDWTQRGGSTDVRGIWLFSGVTQAVLRGNGIGNIRNLVNGWWAFGIEHSGGAGSSLLCSSNSIWGIGSTGAGTGTNLAAGIWSSSALNSGDRYYYNSIHMYGVESSTSPESRSSAMEFVVPAPSGLRLRNNIGVNTTLHGGGGPATRAYAVYLAAPSWPGQDTCDRNDWWTPGASGAVGYFNGQVRSSLGSWRTATGQDGSSLSADPRFVNLQDLHVALGSSPVGNAAVPLAGEAVDIDGDPRSPVAPDIGSDEFGAGHITVTVPLLTGWNMIASPVLAAAGGDSVRRLFAGALAPYAFAFSPSSGYEQHFIMENGKGYWEKFAMAGSAYPAGNMLLTDTIYVDQGWNMVGSISVPVDTGSVVALPAGIKSSSWFAYAGGYAATDSLIPGRAYWIKASAAGRFILQGPPPVFLPPIVRNSGVLSR
jgi:hypothetical protein